MPVQQRKDDEDLNQKCIRLSNPVGDLCRVKLSKADTSRIPFLLRGFQQ